MKLRTNENPKFNRYRYLPKDQQEFELDLRRRGYTEDEAKQQWHATIYVIGYQKSDGSMKFGRKLITLEDAEFLCAYMQKWYPVLEHSIVTVTK